ncbi:Major Facilitator Superfamily protein [Nonomuraea solani]|uniref:Major Facilitator Superfamily protein n=1 Tax=Nonomuraea solani TaxID=1144553 RepID=A0A1H6ETD9_9ACTN|nr:MFS transporter [Nonomuraea solani]SEG99954.1 Major Facilitator Superfamily protein [Nonomuraea solani]
MSFASPSSLSSPRAVVGVLAGSGIGVALMQTLVIPLIPDLPRLLHTSPANASWVLTATLLAGAVATPVAGRLGDLYGKRRLLVISTIALVAGSLVCALSDSLAPVVAGRALQGVSVGVIPLGISIMRDELPPERLGSAMAVMSSSLGVGGALGLPVAAAIAQYADWHALFWASAGLGALMAVLILVIVPESPVRARARFDLLGALGLSAGLVCLLLPVAKGADWGWTSGATLGLFAAAALILPLWGWWELRVRAPLVDLRTTVRRQILLTNLASIVVGFSMYALSLIGPTVLQLPAATGYGLGLSMFEAGLWMAPGGLVMMAVSPLAARLSRVRSPKISLFTGSLVIAAGYLVALPLMGYAWGILIAGSVISAGIGLAFAAMPALIMGAVPVHETAAANGLNALMRSIGTSASSAVVGAVLAGLTIRLGPVPVPSADGLRTGLVIGAAAALAAALVTLGVPERVRQEGLPPAVVGLKDE